MLRRVRDIEYGKRLGELLGCLSLTAVRPRLVVASCGAFNRFGHPGKQLRQWLEEQHIPLLQTGRHGHVRVTWPLSGGTDGPLLDWDTARPIRP